MLVDAGTDVNAKDKKGRTALMWAAGGEITKLLIAKGADVHADSYGMTALSLARWANDAEKIRLLAGRSEVISPRNTRNTGNKDGVPVFPRGGNSI